MYQITNSQNKIKTIGIRNGEKLSETLATEEELENSLDLGNYWKIKSINNFNEDRFYFKGKKEITNIKAYDSSLIKTENLDSICNIILKNEEYKRFINKI